MLKDDIPRRQLGRNAHWRVKKLFVIEAIKENLLNLYGNEREKYK